jgi:hypothetical protein
MSLQERQQPLSAADVDDGCGTDRPTEMAYCMAITFRGGHPRIERREPEMENLWSVAKSSSPNYERAVAINSNKISSKIRKA